MNLRTVILILLATALSACSSLGLTKATNLEQQVVYGYSAVTASLNTLAAATNAGLVNSSEATQINSDLLIAKAQLDQAITLVCGAPPPATGTDTSGYCPTPTDSPSAPAIIATATSALTSISSYFACKQAKEASCPLP